MSAVAMHPIVRVFAYGRGILTQFTTTSNGSTHFSGGFFIVSLAIGIGLAFIPAAIASGKGRSFGLWYLFGLLCFLPALIVAIVISDERKGAPYGAAPYGAGWNPQPGGWVPPGSTPTWGPPPGTPPPPSGVTPSWATPAPPPPTSPPPASPPPPAAPAGWYPDPGGTAQQRYWDGTRWTDNLH